MLILHATTDILRVVTGSAADVEPVVSMMETDNAAPPVVQDIPNVGPLASITTATTTTIADCTTANRRRNVKHISLYNNHASQATTCRVEFSDGTLVSVLANVNLLAGEMLLYTQGGMWLHYDSNGAVYPSIGNAASQAEMEAGTATDKYVTPQGMNWHPGVAKCGAKQQEQVLHSMLTGTSPVSQILVLDDLVGLSALIFPAYIGLRLPRFSVFLLH